MKGDIRKMYERMKEMEKKEKKLVYLINAVKDRGYRVPKQVCESLSSIEMESDIEYLDVEK